MKLVSWNVNGLRACMGKGFGEFFAAEAPDICCLQEIKAQAHQLSLDLPEHHIYLNSAERPGYSGTALFTREEPKSVEYGIGIPEHDREGRVITARYPAFTLVNCYTPNSQDALARLDYRMEWERVFLEYLLALDKEAPVVLCGDLNVAHAEIDLKNPKTNQKNPGFTPEERAAMTRLLESGFADTFRTLYPERVAYSWWSYRMNARAKNVGWRIDYWIVSQRLLPSVRESAILSEVTGSDHCPVVLTLEQA